MGRAGAGHRPRGGRRKNWTTVVTATFARDVEFQVAWALAQDREAWGEDLKGALRAARRLLQATPQLVRADEGGARRLLLGRLPLFLWYRVEEESCRVIWLRLFHVRQASARGAAH